MIYNSRVKKSKNTGIMRGCPVCAYPIASEINIKGACEVRWKAKCANCILKGVVSYVLVEIVTENKPKVMTTRMKVGITTVILIGALGLFAGGKVTASKVLCPSFPTQPIAQMLFESDRHFFRHLDGDKDGIACENRPKY